MKNEISIRYVKDEDFVQWTKMYSDYASVWEEPITEERLKKIWKFLTQEKHHAFGLVACSEKDLAGFCHYMTYPHTYSAKYTCYIQDIYVLPKYRMQGIATRLIENVAETGKNEGWNRIHWKTFKDNKIAQTVYDKIATRGEEIHYMYNLPSAQK